MNMEIILHCGFPKTATTFLQFFFFYNKLQLEKMVYFTQPYLASRIMIVRLG